MIKINSGKNNTDATTAPKLPMTVSFNANNPFPFSKNLCPGRTPNACAESGAPRKILGIASRNVWVTDIEIMKIDKMNGLV